MRSKFFFISYGPIVYSFITKTIDDAYLLNICDRIDKLFACLFREPLITNIMWRNLLIQVNYLSHLLVSLVVFADFTSNQLQDFEASGNNTNYLFILLKAIIFGNFQAMYQVSVLLVLNFRGRSILGLSHDNNQHAIKVKNTLIFNAFVLCQVSLHDLVMGKYR